jgi:hypothetical protein
MGNYLLVRHVRGLGLNVLGLMLLARLIFRESRSFVVPWRRVTDGSYLHSLEQEVAALRAQVQSLTSGPSDHIGQTKRDIAHGASQAIASFRPEYPTPMSAGSSSMGMTLNLAIDPSLTGEHETIRSPWDSSPRRGSDQYPDSPRGHGRSNSVGGHATSLTRLVHDAALRTGHASNSHSHSTLNQAMSNASGSEKGSTTDSPGLALGIDLPPPDRPGSTEAPTPRSAVGSLKSAGQSNSPHTSSTQGKQKRQFAIPPLPPQAAVERLVAAYVDFVGVAAPIIHIPTLGKQLLKIREGGSDVEESDVFIVMMMLGMSIRVGLANGQRLVRWLRLDLWIHQMNFELAQKHSTRKL